jgi:hypothetical protein
MRKRINKKEFYIHSSHHPSIIYALVPDDPAISLSSTYDWLKVNNNEFVLVKNKEFVLVKPSKIKELFGNNPLESKRHYLEYGGYLWYMLAIPEKYRKSFLTSK